MPGDADPSTMKLDEFWADLVRCHNNVPALQRTIAASVVGRLGGGCVLATLTPEGNALHAEVVLHADPVIQRAMEAVLGGRDTLLGDGIAGTVAVDRRSVMLNELRPSVVAETTPEAYLPFVQAHPMKALMIVPLVGPGDQLLGTLGAVRTDSDAPFELAELHVLEALGERAALAMAEAQAAPRAVGPSDFEAIFLHSLDGVLLTTPDGHILAANPAACAALGMTEDEIVARGRTGIVLSDDPRLGPALAERADLGRTRTELTLRRGDGTTFVADVSSTIFTTPNGTCRACVIFRDITPVAEAREATMAKLFELEQAADLDDLTGLWNRRGFGVAAHQALAAADRDGVEVEVLYIDINDLKEVNDRFGHRAGDTAIVSVADAIRGAIREVDVAARLGGDEFVVLLSVTGPDDLAAIVERIEAALASAGSRPVTISTGSARRTRASTTPLIDLVEAADLDMYEHKLLNRLRARRGPDDAAPTSSSAPDPPEATPPTTSIGRADEDAL